MVVPFGASNSKEPSTQITGDGASKSGGLGEGDGEGEWYSRHLSVLSRTHVEAFEKSADDGFFDIRSNASAKSALSRRRIWKCQ